MKPDKLKKDIIRRRNARRNLKREVRNFLVGKTVFSKNPQRFESPVVSKSYLCTLIKSRNRAPRTNWIQYLREEISIMTMMLVLLLELHDPVVCEQWILDLDLENELSILKRFGLRWYLVLTDKEHDRPSEKPWEKRIRLSQLWKKENSKKLLDYGISKAMLNRLKKAGVRIEAELPDKILLIMNTKPLAKKSVHFQTIIEDFVDDDGYVSKKSKSVGRPGNQPWNLHGSLMDFIITACVEKPSQLDSTSLAESLGQTLPVTKAAKALSSFLKCTTSQSSAKCERGIETLKDLYQVRVNERGHKYSFPSSVYQEAKLRRQRILRKRISL